MKLYHDLLNHVLEHGKPKGDRTKTGTISRFGHQVRHDLSTGFPLLTTKRIYWKGVVRELQWFLRGETNIRPLLLHDVHIWSEWPHRKFVQATGEAIDIESFEGRILTDEDFATQWGDLGPVYGKQWRRWQGNDGKIHDQVADVIQALRTNPEDRGIIVSGWNVPELAAMSLRPCHTLYQWNVSDDGRKLDCQLYQRSADSFLGVPFNMASAALWTHILAQIVGLEPGDFIHTFGDLHIYSNHLEQVKLQLSREPRALPRLRLDPRLTEIDAFAQAPMETIILDGYNPWPAIKAPVAV